MAKGIETKIFKNSSSTFYGCALLFPKEIRHDVFDLYSFVRVVDDYVDKSPPDRDNFIQIKKKWSEATVLGNDFDTKKSRNDSINERVIKNIVRLIRKYNFDHDWIDLFFKSMEKDLNGSTSHIESKEELLSYIHGSAEVVGVMMARIMQLPKEADEYAKLQGRALQMINFIRDIIEDTLLGRCYFTRDDLEKFGLNDLSEHSAKANPEAFNKFIRFQVDKYKATQKKAEKGYKFIPKSLLIPIKTSANMYFRTADQITKDPFLILKKCSSKQFEDF